MAMCSLRAMAAARRVTTYGLRCGTRRMQRWRQSFERCGTQVYCGGVWPDATSRSFTGGGRRSPKARLVAESVAYERTSQRAAISWRRPGLTCTGHSWLPVGT